MKAFAVIDSFGGKKCIKNNMFIFYLIKIKIKFHEQKNIYNLMNTIFTNENCSFLLFIFVISYINFITILLSFLTFN